MTRVGTYRPKILALGGTTRAGSTSEKALIAASTYAQEAGATVDLLVGPDLVFPIFDPALAGESEGVRRFRALLRACDGLIISTAAYHGAMPGMLKNALDYIDDSVPERPFLAGRAVGCIACAGGWQATGSALAGLRSIVHALRAWPVPLGVAVNSNGKVFDERGACVERQTALHLREMATQVVEFALMQQTKREHDRTNAASVSNSTSVAELS